MYLRLGLCVAATCDVAFMAMRVKQHAALDIIVGAVGNVNVLLIAAGSMGHYYPSS